jgi:hypothetical protein
VVFESFLLFCFHICVEKGNHQAQPLGPKNLNITTIKINKINIGNILSTKSLERNHFSSLSIIIEAFHVKLIHKSVRDVSVGLLV